MDDKIPSNLATVPARQYAALCLAVGALRAALYDIVSGEVDKDHLNRLYKSTSADEIAKTIGNDEKDMASNWNEYLSNEEKQRIVGN
jgi:hypothetical protein